MARSKGNDPWRPTLPTRNQHHLHPVDFLTGQTKKKNAQMKRFSCIVFSSPTHTHTQRHTKYGILHWGTTLVTQTGS